MSLLRPGSKSLVFVTHVDFFRAKCHIFCQVGDVGSQADTVAERVTESVETGTAGPVSSCNRGDLCLALFHSDNSWYRAKVLKTASTSVTVFFIDYGNTETVDISNVRQANDFVLSIPALSTNCIIADCTPIGENWSEEEKKKTETMLLNGEYNIEVLSVEEADTGNPVYMVKLYNLEDGSSPIFVRPASSSSLAIPIQRLNVGQSYEVFLSYVESADKFWVQLKDQENDLNSLMADVAACFAEDLPSTGDLINPVKGQLCASCFSEDGAFYRSIVQDLRGDKCTVLFVDYGNYEEKSVSELFTLPQVLCKLPMQGIKCSYKADGNKAMISSTLEKYATTDSSYIMTVVASVGRNQYTVQITSVEELLVSKAPSPKGPHQQQQGAAKVQNSMWQSYQAVFMQVESIYDVCISHADYPGSFFIQLVANAPALDDLMDSIDKVAHNFEKIPNLYTGCTCLAQFGDNAWYRAQILSVKPTTARVGAVDFGHVEELPHGKLKVIPSNYSQLPAQAISCSLDFSKGGREMWTDGECDLFKQFIEKKSLAAKVTSKKGFTYQLDLYEMGEIKERHVNSELNSLPKPTKSFQPALSQQMQPSPPLPKSKHSLPQPEAAVGAKLVLMFTAVKMPFLYGQLTHTPIKKVAQLQTDLNDYFEKNKGALQQNSDVGTVCCTQYVDGGWYRGIVVSITGSKIEVAFADFGDSVLKTTQDLKALPAHLLELPQQCILFKAENVPALTREKAEKMFINNKVEVTLTRKEEGAFPTFSGQINSRHILEKLQDHAAPSQSVFKGASSRTFGNSRQAKDVRTSTSSDSGFSQQQVTVGSSQEVMVTYVKDPSNFMVVLDKMNSSLDVVMDQMHEFYDVLPPDGERLENPGLGQPCVAQFSEDKAWYRAVVTGLKSSGPAEVMYVDYGNNEYTDREALKSIKPQYMNLPAQAILCCLSGVASAQGFWSPEHIVQFEEMVVEQSFMANFCSSFHEQGQLVHKVELLDKKGESINQKFGTMTNTLSVEKNDTSQTSRGVGASNMGPDMRITVNVGDGDNGWDESEDTRQVGFGNKASFGGRQERGAGDAGFRGRSERGGFGGGSRGGDPGRSEGGRPERSFGGRSDSGGFGNRSENQGFRSGGGFGGGGESGFGKKSDSDGFGRQGGSGGFSSRSDGSGFGERSGGGGSRDCFKCGESGHISRDCPNAPARGGGGGRECFKCGEAGHMARDCPNPGKGGGGSGGRGRECFKCGESGHMARDCPNPGKGGDRRGGGFSSDSREDRRGGGFGGGGSSGERQTGGFGGRSGGFGNKPDFGGNDRGFASNNADEDWGDSDNSAGQKGFGRSDSGAGQKGFGNRGGGFGQGTGKQEGFGNRSGGFGKGGGTGFGGNTGAGGFGGGNAGTGSFGGATQEEDDWGTDDTVTPPQQLVTTGNIGAMRQTTEVNNEAVMEGSLQVYELEVQDAVDVYVVYTNSPDQFWCQVIKSSKELENMMEEMNAVYESLEGTDLNLVNPDIGMPCAAKFSEDNMWYRAEIITPSEEEIEVLFLDYGNTEIIPASNMKVLKPEFMKLKAQGLRCSLDGVLPTNKVWTDEASQFFEDLTIDKHLLAKVMNTTSSGTYLVDLENVDDKINIAEILAEKGFCSFSSTKPATPVKKELVISPYPSLDITAGEEIDVYLSWIENPEQFWAQIASRENTLLELVDKVQEEYTTGSGANMKVSSLKVGDAVISPYSEDGAWYRGFVEDIDGDNCSVRFTDYGNADKVCKDSLRLPTDELLAAPSEAAYCKLTGIRPLQSGSWTADAKDIMESLVKDLLVKCKVVEISNKHYSVTLVANDVDISKELINAAVAREEKEQGVQGMDIQEPSEVGVVLTFRENESLQTGASENVYVAHTDSVASFWCQPVKTASQLEELMTKLESHCQSAPATQKPRVGTACAAKFSEDAQWYRAKVIAAYPDSVEVLFVDYGNCEKVSNTDLCQLSEELVELEPQAIQCELENVSNASNQLTAKFTEMVADQEVTAKVIDVQEGMATITMTLPDGRSVDAELGLSKVAEVPNAPSKQEEKIGILTSYPKQVVPQTADVFISHVNTPADFYVHRADQEEQLNELMEKIAESYETADMPHIENISKGEICCCLFTEDGAWYRAQVKDVDENKVMVRYVDYGNEEKVTIDSIKHLSSKFISLAPFALHCSLLEVKPIQSQWSEDAVEKFKSLTADQVHSCEFISETKVKLTLDGRNISEMLIEFGHCVKEGKQSELNDDILVFSPQSVPTESVPCYISHISTTGEVYIQLVSEEESLNNITEKIQNVEKDESLDLMSVRIKQCLCARFCEDQSWYRSQVTAVKEGSVEVLFVDYGNKQSVTESSDLRPMNREDIVTPPLAYACRLSGVKHLNEDQIEILTASTADKELTVTFLSTESVFEVNISDENGDRIEKVLEGHHDEGSMKDNEVKEITEAISTVTVSQPPASSDRNDELQDNTSSTNVVSEQEDTRLPDTNDGDTSKDIVVDKEPDKDVVDGELDQKESLEHTETDTGVETITDAISKVTVQNVEGCLKEMEDKKDEGITVLDEEVELECKAEDTDAHQVNLDNMVTHEDQLEKQTLSSDQRFKVAVSHSDSPSRFWVQDLQFQQELDDLLNKMFEFYSSCTDERLMFDEIRENQIVAALHSEDESWYRAKIRLVKDDDCMVMFLDHGNTETVMRENLRKLPLEFASLSVQGIPCSLGAIQPSGGEWSKDAIEEFHTLTQDKELLMDVSSQEDSVYKVSLLDMGMSLNTLLIEKGVGAEEATPVAISTKVKQVFSPDNQDVIAQLYVAKASKSLGKYRYVLRDLTEFLTSNQTVVVTDVNSPHDFTCRLEDNTYEYYQDKLAEAYTVNKEQLQDPKQGDKCVVKLDKDDKFYHRASVISVNQDQVKVVLVDKGTEACVNTANLHALEADFEKDPALAFQCSLSAVVPVKDEWSEQSTLVFREALLEFSSKESLPVFAKAQIVSVEDEVVNVELYLGKTSMDDVLIKKEVAVLNDIDKTIDEYDTSDLVIDRFGVFQNVILDCDKDHYVNLHNCDNLDEIVVHTSQGLNIVKEITETIVEFTKSKSDELGLADDYSSGPCLARSDGVWCRANLLTVTSKEEEKYYQVFLVDYGTEYAVKREDIMALPEDLLKIPGQAVVCHLDEIEPFEAEWGEDSLELFRTHYISDEADIVIYVSSYNNGYHSVVLTKATETESANKMLVELGFASPVAGSSLEMSVMIDNAETSFQEVSLMREDSYGGSDGLGDTSGLTETSTDTAVSDVERSTDTVEEKDEPGDDSHSKEEVIENKNSTEQVKVIDQAVENGIKDPEEEDDSDKDDFEDADDKIKASREGSMEKGTKEEEGEDFYDVQEDVKD